MVPLLLWCGADCLAQTAASKPDRTTATKPIAPQVKTLIKK
jgi:hypothetical protein